jgi:hypothetical protein
VNLRFIDWIWQVRGSLALAPGQSRDDAFARLEPLFHQAGTSHHRSDDTLMFSKKNQAAQDRMSVFDSGVLQIAQSGDESFLRYQLSSRALLFCFLASFLFVGIAQLTIVIGKFDTPPPKPAEKHADIRLNPIDKALGAPEPEKPKDDGDKDKDKDAGEKLSPKAAYVFAAIFALLFAVGRILEDRLVKALFRRRLSDS